MKMYKKNRHDKIWWVDITHKCSVDVRDTFYKDFDNICQVPFSPAKQGTRRPPSRNEMGVDFVIGIGFRIYSSP